MHRTFRACISAYVVFAVISSVFIGGGIWLGLTQSDWRLALTGLGVLLLFYLALSRFRLIITPECVAYRSPLGGERSVRCSEIVSVKFASDTGAMESPLTLVIRSTSGPEIRMNAKVFSLEAIRCVSSLSPDNSGLKGAGPNQAI